MLSTGDRALRVVGGVLGARSITAKAKPAIDPVNPLNLADRPSTTNLPTTSNPTNRSTIPPGPSAPAVVTPDGATFNWRMPLEPTLKPSIPGIGGNISRPSVFTPGLAITGVRENQSSNSFGGPLGRPDPLEAKNHLIIDPTPEGQARQVRELRESLSPEAKQLFDDEYKTVATNQEFLLRISKTGDPTKMYEARAKKVSPEGVEAQNQARLASEARINQAKLQLDNPTFLNKQQVKDAIAKREPNDLRAEIAVELTRQELEATYLAVKGYKVLSEVKVLEEIPGFSTRKEWELANPGKPSNYIFEKDNKIYQPTTDVDLVVVKPNPKTGLSEVVHLEQIKSGDKDKYADAKMQMDKTIDVLKRIDSGDPTLLINEKRTTYDDTTKEYDFSNIDKATKIIRGPERKDSIFDKGVGLSTKEMNQLSEKIIKERNP